MIRPIYFQLYKNNFPSTESSPSALHEECYPGSSEDNFDDDSDSGGVTSEHSLKKWKIKSNNDAVTKKTTQGCLVGSQIEAMRGTTQDMNHHLEKKSKKIFMGKWFLAK